MGAKAIVKGNGGQQAARPPGGGGRAHTRTRDPALTVAWLLGASPAASASSLRSPGLDRLTRRLREPLGRESHRSPWRRRENNLEEWKCKPSLPQCVGILLRGRPWCGVS